MKYNRPLHTLRGLTLIEVMVVIAIIGILAAVISVNAVESGKISRDAKRQADLRMLQSAVELYKNKHGRYPYGCRAPEGAWVDTWSGQSNSGYPCPGNSSQYIIGLAPAFIPVLPYDDKINGNNSGYVYRTNAEGSVYKIMAMRTVESESVDYGHEFKSCHIIPTPQGDDIHYSGSSAWEIDTAGWCRMASELALDPSGFTPNRIVPLPNCLLGSQGNGRFEISYGVWGGFAAKVAGTTENSEVRNTTRVICK